VGLVHRQSPRRLRRGVRGRPSGQMVHAEVVLHTVLGDLEVLPVGSPVARPGQHLHCGGRRVLRQPERPAVVHDRSRCPVQRQRQLLSRPALVTVTRRRVGRRVVGTRLIRALDVVVHRVPAVAHPRGLIVRPLGTRVLRRRVVREAHLWCQPTDRRRCLDRVGVGETTRVARLRPCTAWRQAGSAVRARRSADAGVRRDHQHAGRRRGGHGGRARRVSGPTTRGDGAREGDLRGQLSGCRGHQRSLLLAGQQGRRGQRTRGQPHQPQT
jgi:hypothetical protein